MKKFALYPYDISNLHILLHKDFAGIKGEDVVECISPIGWGYEFEDAGYKLGIDTDIQVKSDFNGLVEDLDVLIITDSILPLPDCDISEKIRKAMFHNVKVVVLRKLSTDLQKSLEEKSNGEYTGLTLYPGNSIQLYSDIDMTDKTIEKIPAPIILVLGAGERCCKFDVQLELREALQKNQYAITQIGSKNYCEFFGFHSFPDFMMDCGKYPEQEKVVGFNKYIRQLYMLENPDVIIIGVPGGAFPFDDYFHNDFGLINYSVSNAIVPDYVIYNSLYVDVLPEYLKDVTNRLYHKFDYETDQIYVSNFALNYAVSKANQILSYITCKTPTIVEQIKEMGVYNIYDDRMRSNAVEALIETLQEYAGISVI